MLTGSMNSLADGITYLRVPPSVPAASVEDFRELLRLEDGEYGDDAMLTSFLMAASDYARIYLNRSLVTTEYTRQWDTARLAGGLSLEYKTPPNMYLTYPPLISVDRVYTIDRDGTERDITGYYVDELSAPARVYFTEFVQGRQIAMLRIEYTAGYGDSYALVPELIQQGILRQAAYMYENRGDCSNEGAAQKSGALHLYRGYRVVFV